MDGGAFEVGCRNHRLGSGGSRSSPCPQMNRSGSRKETWKIEIGCVELKDVE
jgi:hypothetical protein